MQRERLDTERRQADAMVELERQRIELERRRVAVLEATARATQEESQKEESQLSTSIRHAYTPQKLSDSDATCTFDTVSETTYANNTIDYTGPTKESKPFVFSFSELDSDSPGVRSLDSSNDVAEVRANAARTEEKILLLSVQAFHVDVFAIYPNLGLAVWTRNYEERRPTKTPKKPSLHPNESTRATSELKLVRPKGLVAIGRCH